MRFISTRGGAEPARGARAVLDGFAPDGGLYVPESFPRVSAEELGEMGPMSYPERCARILGMFFDDYGADGLAAAAEEALSGFEDDDPVPLIRIDEGVYVLELFHGPTCSDKDLSVRLLPHLLDEGRRSLGVRGPVLVAAATTGDCGKAVLEAFRGRDGYRAAALYPEGGVSGMQRIALSAQEGDNVCACAVKGTFDETQAALRALSRDVSFVKGLEEAGYSLACAGSCNVGRIVPQVAFFFSAYLDMAGSGQIAVGDEIDFCVPAGNMGLAAGALWAREMGLPVRRVHLAFDENDAVAGLFARGELDARGDLRRTTSPSLDVLRPLNLERLLFEATGRDPGRTRALAEGLERNGRMALDGGEREALAAVFDASSVDEDGCVEAVYDLFTDAGYTLDPDSGRAMRGIQERYEKNRKDTTPQVLLCCVTPYKYPQDSLYSVTGNDVRDEFKGVKRLRAATAMDVPKAISDLKDRPPRFTGAVRPGDAGGALLRFARGGDPFV